MSSKRVSNLSYVAVTIVSLSILFSCNSSGCLENKSSIPLAGFYSSEGQKISVSSLTIGGVDAPNDTLLINNVSASQIYLPFRSTADKCRFFIHYNSEGIDDDSLNDTISFEYSSALFFVSEECGALYQYTINSISSTNHFIDRVEVVDPLVTNVDAEQIKIYFKTEETE